MNDLKSLAIRYVTDKEISFGHDYIPGYIDLFEKKRYDVKNVLEIGIGLRNHYVWMKSRYPDFILAGCLMMWRDYFPNAHIFGMDIHACSLVDESRITTIVGDQGNESDLLNIAKQMGGSIDVIIDDGSHLPHHQVFSFMILSQFLSKGGIYVIEDVDSPHIPSFMSLSIFPKEFQEYIHLHFDYKWYDTRGEGRPADDFLMVFIKK